MIQSKLFKYVYDITNVMCSWYKVSWNQSNVSRIKPIIMDILTYIVMKKNDVKGEDSPSKPSMKIDRVVSIQIVCIPT